MQKDMQKVSCVVLNNIRSCYNVGSILRTAEFFGVKKVYFVGVTPYPTLKLGDDRLPHIAQKLDKQIKKVSLGSEDNLELEHFDTLKDLIVKLKSEGLEVVGLEQDPKSVNLDDFKFNSKLKFKGAALVLGEETQGLSSEELSLVDRVVEISRIGKKESLNVSVAFGVAISRLN